LADRFVRLIFVPILGFGIPTITGLYGTAGPDTLFFWAASAWFLLISFTIWQGNRYVYGLLPDGANWLERPWSRALLLLTTSLLYTTPASIGLLWGWYQLAGVPPDWGAIRAGTLSILVCTTFIVYTYETVYLVRSRARAQVAVEKLARAKAQAELAVLKGQIDPHFMFNCLNTLAGLIEEEPDRAGEFTVCLAEVYRYILDSRKHDLVPLSEELSFLRNYYSLLRLRFDEAIDLRITINERDADEHLVPPVSLQLLLENAVKHNDFSANASLAIYVSLERDHILVWNEKRPLAEPKATSQLGLKNLDERCRLLLGRPIETHDEPARFSVRLPIREDKVRIDDRTVGQAVETQR
jgi:sensor histidine kinase YesM